MSSRALSAVIIFAGAIPAACHAAPASTGDARLDSARAAVASDFSGDRRIIFRNERVVEVVGEEGSKATVVCGDVNRRGRDTAVTGGWRPYYYVVSYNPVPLYGPPNMQAMLDDEPGAFEKVTVPAIYAAGDYAVLFGADDASIGDPQAAEAFGRSWTKFCTGSNTPISEHILQTWR